MKRILVPFDFSPMAARALRLAVGGFVAGDADRVIDVVHVNETGANDELLRAQLSKEVSEIATPGAQTRVEQRVLVGSPWRQLVDHAEATGPDLIILGARSHGKAQDLFVGRTAFRVLRHTRSTVMMLKRDDVTTPPRNIVCAVDLAKDPAQALTVIERASQLSVRAGAKLSVLHLIEEGVAPAFLRTQVNHLWAKIAEDARVQLGALVSSAQAKAEVVEVIRGHVRDQLPRFVERVGAELVVVGSHQSAAVERLLLGSFAEAVVQLTVCDVLVVRSRA